MPTPINPIGTNLDGPGESFFDPGTGKRRRRGEPLKTAVEAANEAPTAPPPPPPPIAPQKFIPLAADVERRRKCSGTVQAHVYFEAEQNDLEDFYNELAIYDPVGAAEVRDHRDNGHASLKLASEKLIMKRSIVGELRNAIVILAETRKEIAETAALLDRVRATLDDPGCLAMDAADLLKLELQRKHLPAKIAELETRAAAEAKAVKDLLRRSQLDGAKFLEHMRNGAGYGPDRRNPQDPHLHSLFLQGFVTLPT